MPRTHGVLFCSVYFHQQLGDYLSDALGARCPYLDTFQDVNLSVFQILELSVRFFRLFDTAEVSQVILPMILVFVVWLPLPFRNHLARFKHSCVCFFTHFQRSEFSGLRNATCALFYFYATPCAGGLHPLAPIVWTVRFMSEHVETVSRNLVFFLLFLSFEENGAVHFEFVETQFTARHRNGPGPLNLRNCTSFHCTLVVSGDGSWLHSRELGTTIRTDWN